MTEDHKNWIDNASYVELLRRWRFSSSDDEIFTGESGKYYEAKMGELRGNMSAEDHTRASRIIGWD